MKYIKAIIWSIVLLIVLVALFAIIKIWGITLPEGWNMSVRTLVNIIAIPFLTGKSRKKYDEKSGKVAQRMEE